MSSNEQLDAQPFCSCINLIQANLPLHCLVQALSCEGPACNDTAHALVQGYCSHVAISQRHQQTDVCELLASQGKPGQGCHTVVDVCAHVGDGKMPQGLQPCPDIWEEAEAVQVEGSDRWCDDRVMAEDFAGKRQRLKVLCTQSFHLYMHSRQNEQYQRLPDTSGLVRGGMFDLESALLNSPSIERQPVHEKSKETSIQSQTR